MGFLRRNIDGFTVLMLSTVALAFFIPLKGAAYDWGVIFSKIIVAQVFFLHGLKLAPQNLWAGLIHWRLHFLILLITFFFFPLVGFVLKPVVEPFLGPVFAWGFFYICFLPSTVQASIAFTSMAGGNVAAAICAASFSSLLGVFLTPLWVSLVFDGVFGAEGEGIRFSWQALGDISLQIVLPFILGQVLRPRLWAFFSSFKGLIGYSDRLSVLFIVYVTFSQGSNSGLWNTLSLESVGALVVACALLLGVVLAVVFLLGRLFKFPWPDRVVILFCGSKKSLISGVPLANILFPATLASSIILPLMIFHQVQLMVCSYIAGRLAQKNM